MAKINFKDIFTKIEKKEKRNSVSDSALMPTKKKKISKSRLFSIATAVILTLAHVVVITAVIFSYRYYAVYPEIFGGAVAIVLCILIILDIVFFVGFNHRDKVLKIVTCVFASLILIGGSVGVYALLKVNGVIGGIIDDGESSKHEVMSGTFVTFDSRVDSLEKLSGEIIGFVSESSNGLAYAGKMVLDENSVDYGVLEYATNIDLLQAISDGEVKAGVFNSAYKTIFENDESGVDYTQFLERCVNVYSFEKEVSVNTTTSTKNLSKDPFNVLLIGWSRVELGSNVGLADAIIIATVNPQTYTVSMTSIARDSYVEIPCYNNAKNKINSGRSTSRACFIETVEQLVGEEMDYYIEGDYWAIVAIVNAVGGVEITNPVAFTLDGIEVPAGTYVATGWQALEFCRERHAFAEGDFARQQHQKEVILGVARKFLESRDLAVAYNALDMCGDYLSTDLTLTQLTSVFNMLLNTKNYTGLDTFDLIDFQQGRMTGYASWFYSYSDEIPLWIYKLYNGSLTESIEHINTVLGNNIDTSNQVYSFKFSAQNPYNRPLFYSLTYDEAQIAEPMPDFFADLTGDSYEEALSWAKEKGVKLKLTFITSDSDEYVAEKDGKVISQSPRYGQLFEKYLNANGVPQASITVMGDPGADRVPDLYAYKLKDAIKWANKYFDGQYKVKYSDEHDNGLVYDQSIAPYELISDYYDEKITFYVYKKANSTSDLTVGKTTEKDVDAWIENSDLFYIEKKYETSEYDEGKVSRVTYEGEEVKTSSPVEIYPTTSGITVYISTGTKVNIKDSISGKKNSDIKNWINNNYGSKITTINYVDSNGKTANFTYYEATNGTCDLATKACTITVKDNSVDVTGTVNVGDSKDAAVSALSAKGITANVSEVSSDASAIGKVVENVSCTGILEKGSACSIKVGAQQYVLTVVSSDESMGSVSGSGTYVKGSSAPISASPAEGYIFVNWSNGDTNPSTSVVVNETTTITANFAASE